MGKKNLGSTVPVRDKPDPDATHHTKYPAELRQDTSAQPDNNDTYDVLTDEYADLLPFWLSVKWALQEISVELRDFSVFQATGNHGILIASHQDSLLIYTPLRLNRIFIRFSHTLLINPWTALTRLACFACISVLYF